jgi:hypothetical protein
LVEFDDFSDSYPIADSYIDAHTKALPVSIAHIFFRLLSLRIFSQYIFHHAVLSTPIPHNIHTHAYQRSSGQGLLDQGTTLWGSRVIKQFWPGGPNLEKCTDTGENGVAQKGKEREAIM